MKKLITFSLFTLLTTPVSPCYFKGILKHQSHKIQNVALDINSGELLEHRYQKSLSLLKSFSATSEKSCSDCKNKFYRKSLESIVVIRNFFSGITT